MKRTAALVALAVLPYVYAQQPVWAQCGVRDFLDFSRILELLMVLF
jgi:hypothetical protein